MTSPSPSPLELLLGRPVPLVMGVVNVTPDSFSDGGLHLDPAAAIEHGLALLRDGADLLDVGGEATNPRAAPTGAREELRRVLPVIEALAAAGATVSVDTTKAEVARAAVAAGASIINDVSGGLFDPAMAAAVADLDVTYVAGHLRGASLPEVFAAEGKIPWQDVAADLAARLDALPPAARTRVWVDPGIGFGKGADPEGNLDLLRHAGDLGRALGRPVVVGPSRKRFLRRLLDGGRGSHDRGDRGSHDRGDRGSHDRGDGGRGSHDRGDRGSHDRGDRGSHDREDAATVAACLGAVRCGAHVLRVHNVALLRAALAVYTKL